MLVYEEFVSAGVHHCTKGTQQRIREYKWGGSWHHRDFQSKAANWNHQGMAGT